MRSGLDGTTSTLYNSGAYDVHARLKVENGSGTFENLFGRYTRVQVEMPNPNAPIGGMRIEFVRELTATGTASSLAPLVEASALNKLDDDTTYSPLLQLGRQVTLEVHLTAEFAARPADGSANWYEIFRGIIIAVSWPQHDEGKVSVTVNGLGGVLQLAKSESAYVYTSGTSLETVAQQILNNNGFGAGDDFPVTLYFPSATGKVLPNDYAPGLQKTVWEQLWALAQSMGWVCWFSYRGQTAVELVFFEPARTKTTPDLTVTAWDFTQLDIDESEVRNVGYIVYVDGSGAEVMIGPYENTASLTKYGGTLGIRRPFWIKLDEFSPIRDGTEAGNMLTAALSDVADPDVIAGATTVPLVFAEASLDLYTIPAMARFFDNSQDLALFSNTIVFEANRFPVSTIGVRGKPTAGANTWRSLGYRLGTGLDKVTVTLTSERMQSQGVDGNGNQIWHRVLEMYIGANTKSLEITVGSFVQALPLDDPGYPSTTIGPWTYTENVTSAETIQHIVEDNAAAAEEWVVYYDEGGMLPATAPTLTITPYDDVNGTGSAGKAITVQLKTIDQYDDIGVRTEHPVVLRIDHNDVARSSGTTSLGGGVTYEAAAFNYANASGAIEYIRRASYYLSKTGTPTGTAVASIYATSAGLPTGAALWTSRTFDVSALTGTLALIDFEFDPPYALADSTEIHVAVEYTGGDGTNYINVERSTAAGNTDLYNGTIWASITGGALVYRLYEETTTTVFGYELGLAANFATKFDTTTGRIELTDREPKSIGTLSAGSGSVAYHSLVRCTLSGNYTINDITNFTGVSMLILATLGGNTLTFSGTNFQGASGTLAWNGSQTVLISVVNPGYGKYIVMAAEGVA